MARKTTLVHVVDAHDRTRVGILDRKSGRYATVGSRMKVKSIKPNNQGYEWVTIGHLDNLNHHIGASTAVVRNGNFYTGQILLVQKVEKVDVK